MITSRSNPKVKLVRSLAQRKQRQATKQFVVEGIHHVGAAIESGHTVDLILYAPDLLTSEFANQLIFDAEKNGVDCLAVSSDVFASVADKQNPSGLLAVVQQRLQALAAAADFQWGVALVTPQDPGNFGTILRTLDAVGATGIIVLDGGVDPYHPTSVRASMGAVFHLPIYTATFADFLGWQAQHQYQLVGTTANADANYASFVPAQKSILLMGPERTGLAPDQLAACSVTLSLPMLGKVTSLNLSVATGVLLYHFQNQFAL